MRSSLQVVLVALILQSVPEDVVRKRIRRTLEEHLGQDVLEHGLVLRQQLAVLHRLKIAADKI